MGTRNTKAPEFFDSDAYPLLVLKDEHHGKVDLHSHDFFELVYIAHGVALHSHEGSTQILTAGDMFIILPGEKHSYINTHDTDLYNCLFLTEALAGLETDLLGLKELNWLLSGRKTTVFERVHAGLAERQEIVLILEQIVWEKLNQPVGWALKLKSLLLALLVVYARLGSHKRLSQDKANPNYRQVLKAVAFIEKNYRLEVSAEAVAEDAGLSVGYLSRQFKALVGTSPSEYARSFRIAKAAELLREGDGSIADIARELGYGDIALFSRQFRQVTGVSPTAFRSNQTAGT